ncbi:ATP-binding protein [Microbacterium sp. NPDC019599]|uniref:ATP-binding protein n=1 Tax=Microbacterium sp. NPDC019599 TaxID=3154690 RepID=UPI003402BC29
MSGTWADDNRLYTAAAFRRVRALLADETGEQVDAPQRELDEIADRMSGLPALSTLEAAFGLSPFERDILLVCAGVELDEGVRRVLADDDDQRRGVPSPTFALALAKLPGAHWSALTPAAPLRRWDLVEVGGGRGLTEAPLRIGERVLHYLAGIHYLDETAGMRHPISKVALSGSHVALAQKTAERLAEAPAPEQPVVQLVVSQPALGEALGIELAAAVGLAAAVVPASGLPLSTGDLRVVARIVEREAVLAGVLPIALVDEADVEPAMALIDEITGPVIVVTRAPIPLRRTDLRVIVPAASSDERLQAWEAALGGAGEDIGDEVRRAADLFDLDPLAIRATAAEFGSSAGDEPEEAAARFWALARDRARPQIDRLAERVSRHATWDDLVLPDEQKQTLRDIAAQARWRSLVQREWGLGPDTGEGMGIAALFAGPSGTGKTMAASVIATDLGLDLYRVDLSQVVSKYIGETEKHLAEIFSSTEGSGCVLLFDEADALFGRRSEVRDSHDRYANLEVSYLLQRMEAYQGLAILTTNLRSALDPAFLRRLRFVVTFSIPDESSRAEIWRKVYPDTVPRVGLDADRLAQLAIPGGNIRTIALNAAFHAAARGGDVTMADVLRATRAEFVKLERTLPEAQVRGWT